MLAARDDDDFPKRNNVITACHVKYGGFFVLCRCLPKRGQKVNFFLGTMIVRICTMTKTRALKTMVLLKSVRNGFLK